MKNQKGFVSATVLIAIVLGLIFVSGGAYYVMHQQASWPTLSDNTLDNLQILPTTNNQNTTSQNQNDSAASAAIHVTIDPIVSTSSNPTFSGTATGVTKVLVGFIVSAPASYTGGKSHGSGNADVHDGHWTYTAPAGFFETGNYTVEVYPAKDSGYVLSYDYTARSTFTISTSPTIPASANSTFPSATIDQNSLVSTSGNPTITGTAQNTDYVFVSVGNADLKCGAQGDYDTGVRAPVVNGKWSLRYTNYTLTPCEDYGVSVTVNSSDPSQPIFLAKGPLSISSSSSSSPLISSSNMPSGWSSNTNSQYGFSISYPTSVTVALASGSLVFSASTQGPSDAAGSLSGGLQITATQNSSASDCLSTPASSEAQISNAQNVTINGLPFFSYKVDDAFAGGSSAGYHYKVLHGTTCFDISYYAQYAGGLAGSKLDISAEESKINAAFLAMVQTFHFTN